MNRKLLWAILLSLIVINKARAERTFLFLGGGGEPESKLNTLFDPGMRLLDNYLNTNKWKNDISFNGGHKDSEALLRTNFKSATSKTSFTKKNYNSIIDSYIKDINSGKIKTGEQLLVYIDSHGAEKTPSETTHNISIGNGNASSDLNNLSGSTTISIDTMKSLVQTAKLKGIKLAIIDMSCHSGSTLGLANESNCIITSTGPNQYGYASFSENFIKNMQKGKSLEDVFLASRKAERAPSYPMISTPAGITINQTIYPKISPYLFYQKNIDEVGKLYDYIVDESSDKNSQCMREAQFKQLENTIENYKRIGLFGYTVKNPKFIAISELLKQYKSLQDKLIESAKKYPLKELEEEVRIVDSVRLANMEMTTKTHYQLKSLMAINCDKVIASAEAALKKTSDSNKKLELLSEISLHKKIKIKQNETKAKYPNLKNYQNNLESDLKDMEKSMDLARNIAGQERDIYDEMYRDLSKSKNSCKDFVL
jgi:hypothetical protein